MKKKLFSLLLGLCLIIVFSFPASIFADTSSNVNAGSAVISGPSSIVKDKAKDSYDVEYTATYTMSADVANKLESSKKAIADAMDANSLEFGFLVKLDSRLSAQKDGKYSYTFDNDLMEVNEDGIKETEEGLYVPCKLKDGWEKASYKEGMTMTLKATAVLPAEKFETGKTLETTGSIQVSLPDQSSANIENINTVSTKMIANLSGKLEPGTVELSGPISIVEDSAPTSYDVEYTAKYTMSEDIADAIETYKDRIADAVGNDALQMGFVVKLDSRLSAKKDGAYSYTFDSPLFEVDEAGVTETEEGLYVPCKLKDGWEKTTYKKGDVFTLTATTVLDADKFEVGKKLETTGEVKVTLPNKESVSVEDIQQVDTLMTKATTTTPTTPTTPTDEDTPEATPSILLMKSIAKGSTASVVSWTKVKGAEGYDVYYAKCNSKKSKETFKKIKTISSKKSAYTVKKLKKGTIYKYRVDAYKKVDGKKVVIARSLAAHSIAGNTNKSYTNTKSVTLKTSSKKITLKKGKSKTIKATLKKVKSSKKYLTSGHAAKVRYVSSNPKVAKVSKSGKVTAVKKGTCNIYVIAVNGIYKTSKVTVK